MSLIMLQFLHLCEAQRSKGDYTTMAESRYLARSGRGDQEKKRRSHSLTAYDESRMQDLADRMKLTESAMEGAHKGNLRGQCIQGVFPTFEDLFLSLPESLAFNVEMSLCTFLQMYQRRD